MSLIRVGGLSILVAGGLLGGPLAAAVEASALRVELGGNNTMELVEVSAGAFLQGSPEDEAGRGADEARHQVTLTKSFYLGKFPVTRGQFACFVKETGFLSEAEKGTSGGFGFDGKGLAQRKEFTWRHPGFAQTDDHPVTLVTWNDAQAFLGWLSRKSGRTFALPSEAQWEYACRAGSAGAYLGAGGRDGLEELAWFKANAGDGTRVVGTKPLNAWGFGDMSGNVWQWCADWYGPYPVGAVIDPVQNEAVAGEKPRRVLRGGSWARDAANLRSAARYRNDPGSRNADNGFRVMTFDRGGAASGSGVSGAPRTFEVEQAFPGAHVAWGPAQKRTPVATIFGAVLMGLAGAAFWILIRAFRRGNRGGDVPPPLPGNRASRRFSGTPRVRVVDDGFWIEPESFPPSSSVLCRYRAGGKSHRITVPWTPGPQGQFFFTGSQPESIAVELESDSTAGQPFQNISPARPEERPRPNPGSRVYPSAY